MTPAQVELVQTTFARIVPIGNDVVETFYATLFARHPEVRALFPHEMAEQRQKLLQTLAYAVNGLKHPDALLPIVRELGAGHRGYKVHPDHYRMVAEALIAALAKALGPEFTKEVEAAWVACYTLIAREMEPQIAA